MSILGLCLFWGFLFLSCTSVLTHLTASLCYRQVSGDWACLGSLISSGPGSHSVLTRASHLALLLNMVADVQVSLSSHFLTDWGRFWCQQPGFSQEVLSTKHCLSKEKIWPCSCDTHMQFVNQKLNLMGCLSLSIQN